MGKVNLSYNIINLSGGELEGIYPKAPVHDKLPQWAKKAKDTSPSKMPSKLWTKDLLRAFPPSRDAETNHPFFPPSL